MFIRIGIVDYVSKEKEYIDEYPELNIYEKIQILIYDSIYPRESIHTSPTNNKSSFINNSKTKPISIPKINKN